MLGVLHSMQGLRRVGLSVQFDKKMLDEYELGGLEVDRDDGLVNMLWRLCTRLFEQRAVTVIIYTSAYPYLMAPSSGDAC